MIRSILTALAVICMAGAASAVTPALGTPVCADGGTCVTDGSDRILIERTGAIGIGVAFVVDNDVYTTGDLACAAVNQTCAIALDAGVADGGDAVACGTTLTAASWATVHCY